MELHRFSRVLVWGVNMTCRESLLSIGVLLLNAYISMCRSAPAFLVFICVDADRMISGANL